MRARRGRILAWGWCAAGSLIAMCAPPAVGADEAWGRRVFTDSRNPPFYQELESSDLARLDLGHAVFNTQWQPAGTDGAERRDGLGPLYNAAACDACHNEGAHGRGPTGDGDAPVALVIELDTAPHQARQDQRGDARYGRTLNTAALAGVAPEARVILQYQEQTGTYPDGGNFSLRAPRYLMTGLPYGPLARRTIIEPRLAPALFGVGLLEAVPGIDGGRFGWQATSSSIREQTAKAFARDMGLTSNVSPHDDCTGAQHECRAAADGGTPEVSDEFFTAVVDFQRYLAVPSRAALGPPSAADLFAGVGCAGCHREQLPVQLPNTAGGLTTGTIEPYTDLHLHDLGADLADRDAAGRVVASRWRTAPLWGIAYRLIRESVPTFLHDGRARSVEEAILWHAGEAAVVRRRFEQLTSEERQRLLRWVEAL